jgi:hypothetical protein
VPTPDGHLETFADTWGALALRLFFERYTAVSPTFDVNALVSAAKAKELHKLIGVPKSWLDDRVIGAADMFISDQSYMFLGFEESKAERRAAKEGATPPALKAETQRRETLIKQIIRRGENRRFLQTAYAGLCQMSGVRLIMPDGSFSIDCAHIRPLGKPHSGKDDVSNMLSLSPTMHRLFDRGCVRIDPDTLAINMLHGNDVPHRPRLLVRENHIVSSENLTYHISNILR